MGGRAVADYVVEFGKDGRPVEADGRLDAAAFHRNHAPIWNVLQKFLVGKSGDVLEAGSGTGQHVVHFARHSPEIIWWPSDLNEAHLKSINAWRAQGAAGGILRQCDPYRAVARRRGPFRRRRALSACRRQIIPLWALQARR